MMRFAEVFPDREIVSALLRQFSWTHFLATFHLAEPQPFIQPAFRFDAAALTANNRGQTPIFISGKGFLYYSPSGVEEAVIPGAGRRNRSRSQSVTLNEVNK